MSNEKLIEENVDLAPFTSWKVGGPAQYMSLPTSVDEVKEALNWAKKNDQPVTVLGGGTNVLVSDKGLSGLVLCTRRLVNVAVTDEESDTFRLEALAGTPKSAILKEFLQRKLPPALFLCGLPGDVGGGVVMNAGVSEDIVPREFNEIVEWVEVVREVEGEQKLVRIPATDIEWTYRHSNGWQPGVVVQAGLAWPNEPDPDVMRKMKLATRNRLMRQPLDKPSCGSVFVNPEGGKSGALIEKSGLKGHSIGGAQVSEKHANFIVNTGEATASDIDALIKHIQKTVKEKTDFELRTEVKYLGW